MSEKNRLAESSVLLITPPFTQLNTPYPGTTYLKGFLNTLNVKSHQCDLGLEVILKIFSKEGLRNVFNQVSKVATELEKNESRILALKDDYIATIDPVIRFLQNKNPTLAYAIAEGEYLPEASRFDQIEDLEWAFGTLGIQDKARHLATLYLEDLGDVIRRSIDDDFEFTKYAERLGRSATSFDELYDQLKKTLGFIDSILIELLDEKIQLSNPGLVCLSVPFPGNLFGALRCGQYIKSKYPKIHVAMGGGYPNTELRALTEPRVFEFIDFITLDDGERPIQNLLEHITGTRDVESLKRTFVCAEGVVQYANGAKEGDIVFSKTGTPDYADLPLTQYLSVIELVNPMHRLWSDGRWNKLTMAHGCYWKKCSFCDISLDYIANYEPVGAAMLCDRMEEQMKATGESGFHFVDEAAPPALMRELALEILRRKLTVSWWANIRFEKRFTSDLCRLLKASGCIAISGGLEVASDRLLDKMQKGVTVEQVAQVAHNFTESGIMVHAYLMYGFPTQTDQETIDSLEMVRQLFELGVIQSGFWHQFAMTEHSPIGINPEAFGVVKVGPEQGDFANNDLYHDDPNGTDHSKYSEGLAKSLFNYMHGICFDFPHQEWFDFEVPDTSVPAHYIELALQQNPDTPILDNTYVVWLGTLADIAVIQKKKKGKLVQRVRWQFELKSHAIEVIMPLEESKWFEMQFPSLLVSNKKKLRFGELKTSFESEFSYSFDKMMKSEAIRKLRSEGLLLV